MIEPQTLSNNQHSPVAFGFLGYYASMGSLLHGHNDYMLQLDWFVGKKRQPRVTPTAKRRFNLTMGFYRIVCAIEISALGPWATEASAKRTRKETEKDRN